MPIIIARAQSNSHGPKRGRFGLPTGADGGAAPPARVVMVRVNVCEVLPGVTVGELNVYVVCKGSPDTLNDTAFVKPFTSDVGVTVIVTGTD